MPQSHAGTLALSSYNCVKLILPSVYPLQLGFLMKLGDAALWPHFPIPMTSHSKEKGAVRMTGQSWSGLVNIIQPATSSSKFL